MTDMWKLSPSDLTFLWGECRRCFYLKIVHGFPRPWAGMPKIFNQIDRLINAHFQGKATTEFSSDLPDGEVTLKERWVTSEPIAVQGHTSTCFIKGRFDSAIAFADSSYGIVDFKTSTPSPWHVPFYSRQLHAYSYALEHPAAKKLNLSPVSRLGLLCFEPSAMERLGDGRLAYAGQLTWLECPKDYETFKSFLGEVLTVLELPSPPESAPRCVWCAYREEARNRGV